MKTRIFGDIHGKMFPYARDLVEAGKASMVTIQIGDFGLGFGQGDYWHDQVNALHSRGNHHFIRGNHDNPAIAKLTTGYIPDGYVENDVMFLGGAWSIDHQFRTMGYDLWEDEECSMEELYRLIDVYAAVKPRVMITHDGPLSITDDMFIKAGQAIGGSNAKSIRTRTGMALETMLHIHAPDLWIFGHWHITKSLEKDGCLFQCIGEQDYMDFDL